MYQIEVKHRLVQFFFPPANGWKVYVDLDPMELARGGTHSPEKAERGAAAVAGLQALGVRLERSPRFGPVDVVAEHPEQGIRLIEVEGHSSRQTAAAVYSALGQLLMSMRIRGPAIRYGLAVPSDPRWERQLRKLPTEVTKLLALDLYLVGSASASKYLGGEAIPNFARS